MSNSNQQDRHEKFKELLADKTEEKKFPSDYIQDIYDIESQYLNQYQRTEGQIKIRQLIIEITPNDIEEQKKINEEEKQK